MLKEGDAGRRLRVELLTSPDSSVKVTSREGVSSRRLMMLGSVKVRLTSFGRQTVCLSEGCSSPEGDTCKL